MFKNINRGVVGLFLVLTILIFQFQNVFGVNELNSLSFTVYSLGGAKDEMNYGNGSEWGRSALSLHGISPDTSFIISESDHMAIRFSVQNECQPFYCIEIGGHLSDLNGDDYSKSNQNYWDQIQSNGKLTGEQINYYLGSVLYYGFHDEFNYTDGSMWNVTYENNIDNINKYIATQILVWETVYAYRDTDFNYVSWPSLNSPLDYINTSPNYAEIINYYNYIEYKIKTSANIPSYMYRTEEEALSHPISVSYSPSQQLYATKLNDSNSKSNSFGLTFNTSKIYANNEGSSEYLNVSIPKHNDITKTSPELIKLSDNSYFTSSSVVTWTSSSKQNGITWGTTVKVPIEGYVAFYPSNYTEPQKGSIKVIKNGDAFTGIEEKVIDEYTLTTPIYSEVNLKDVSFSLYADSDIYLDEEILYTSGELIKTETTNEEGEILFDNLGEGTYILKETENPNKNYILNNDAIKIDLDWLKEDNFITKEEVIVSNEYKTVKISGVKEFETINEKISINLESEMSKVVIGLYAGEDIKALNGVIINENTLIETITPKSNGEFLFETKLPEGKYYIKELKGSDCFKIDNSLHYIDSKCNSDSSITVNASESIVNSTTTICGSKKTSSGEALSGAVIGIYSDIECLNELDRVVSDENGEFKFNNLITGDYYIKEIEAPIGYLLNTECYKVSTYNDIETELIIVNNEIHKTPENTPTPIPEITPEPELTPSITPEITPEPNITPIVTPEPSLTPEITPPIEITNEPPKTYNNPPKKSEPPITNTGEDEHITTAIGRSIILAFALTVIIRKSYIHVVSKVFK